MRLTLVAAVVLALGSWAAAAWAQGAGTQPPQQQPQQQLPPEMQKLLAQPPSKEPVAEAKVIPPDWPAEQTFEFAIFDASGNRIATAYYRILQAESDGRKVYWLKYVGRNEQMSESSECWVDRDTLLPLRSTRKLVSGRTMYQDVAYSNGVIVVRKKYDDDQPQEKEFPAPTRHYDYEQLIWLVPQLDFQGASQVRFNLFSDITETQASVIVTDVGIIPLTIDDNEYQSHNYAFDINLVPYKEWTVMQNGVPVVAQVTMGSTKFINMRLDPDAAGAMPTGTEKPAQPAQKPKEKPKEPEKKPANPNENPLGPPPPGSRF